MKVNKLNVAQIVWVKSYINATRRGYVYKKAKKRFLRKDIKEGFYDENYFNGSDYITKEEIEEAGPYFCKDEKVYYYPHLEIRMSDGSLHEKYFKTEEELTAFMETDEMKSITWINK